MILEVSAHCTNWVGLIVFSCCQELEMQCEELEERRRSSDQKRRHLQEKSQELATSGIPWADGGCFQGDATWWIRQCTSKKFTVCARCPKFIKTSQNQNSNLCREIAKTLQRNYCHLKQWMDAKISGSKTEQVDSWHPANHHPFQGDHTKM